MADSLYLTNLFSVKGLVALITGGGTGIGLMMARALVESGAERVYIAGRRMNVLLAAASAINGSTRPAVVVPLCCDVTSRESLQAAAAVVEQETGRLHLLVCNAGVGGPQTATAAPGEALEDWRRRQMAVDPDAYTDAFRVNATAAWFTAMAMLGLLDAGNRRGDVEQSSQVVVVASIGAFFKKPPGNWAYTQSKAAAVLLAKQLSAVLPTWNIRANCIAPGLFPSEMSAAAVQKLGGSTDAGPGEAVLIDTAHVPLGRLGDEKDMAGQLLYLASRAGAYCNGAVMIIDGGRLNLHPSSGY